MENTDRPQQQNKFSNWLKTSITARMLMLGFLIIILFMPLSYINSLIEEKDRLYVKYQSLKENNEDLVKELQLLQSQKETARTKAEDILQRINDIESSA